MSTHHIDLADTRDTVQGFARLMEVILRRHDATKGRHGWYGASPEELFDLMDEKMSELSGAIADEDYRTAGLKAVDIGNFCMMMVSNIVDPEQEETGNVTEGEI